MSDTGDKRVTRQSVSEASTATDQGDDSFENFVMKSLTSMGAKMDSILAGHAALENRCNICPGHNQIYKFQFRSR